MNLVSLEERKKFVLRFSIFQDVGQLCVSVLREFFFTMHTVLSIL